MDLHKGPGGRIDGDLEAPAHFHLSAGDPVFTEVGGPLRKRRLTSANSSGDELELSFGAGADITTFRWHLTDPNSAELSFRDFVGVKLPFVRARRNESVSPEFDPEKAYAVQHRWPSNPEMKSIFAADQAARSSTHKIDWAALTKADADRRARTKALLDAGDLKSGLDFLRAAFVFQHGSTSADYLLAHTLALVAMARGRPDAAWISAATLDRYLQSVGKKQIFGTQTTTAPNAAPTKEPYDRGLVSDELRHALGVP